MAQVVKGPVQGWQGSSMLCLEGRNVVCSCETCDTLSSCLTPYSQVFARATSVVDFLNRKSIGQDCFCLAQYEDCNDQYSSVLSIVEPRSVNMQCRICAAKQVSLRKSLSL